MTRTASTGWRPGGGSVLFIVGVVGLLLGGAQRAGAPVPFYFGEWLLILLFLGTTVAGASLTWQDDHRRTSWSPRQPGRRFQTAVLYTRRGCHLCDEAHQLLAAYADYLPELVLVDIDVDPARRDEFDTCVPVVEFDGRVRFRGEVSERMLQRLLEGTPSADV
ncbi:MAG: glutaredoxin family protein [Planctomycetaceae bacterium]|nr:glutaredoxin family protein [Planctomycetaceae bacterium]